LRNTRIVTIICWAVSALALTGLVVWFLVGNVFGVGFGFDFGLGNFDVVGEHSVSANDIDSLSIDWTSGAVYVGTHSGSDIQITEFSRRDLRDGEELSFNTDDSTLSIYFTENMRRFSIGINNFSKQLEVLIPHALSDDFDRFHVNTVSGRVLVSNIEAEDFNVRTTSGRIELRDITAPRLTAATTSGRIELFDIASANLNASTTSGRIEITDIEADEIQLRTVSGRIEARRTQADSLRTNTTSGRHELAGSFGYVNARSTSGRIEITSAEVPERLTARASSGRIAVTVPNEGAITVQYSTGSGRFTSELPVTTGGGANAQFDLSTSSGRIEIFALRG